MKSEKWIETKREAEVSDDGTTKITKVTLERIPGNTFGLSSKDFLDIVLRAVGIVAIFIPILLYFLQQRAERLKQKSLLQIEVYSTTVSELHGLSDKPFGTIAFERSAKKFVYEIYPKLLLLNDKSTISLVTPMKGNLEFSLALAESFKVLDAFEIIYDSISNLIKDTVLHKYPTEKMFFRRNYSLITMVNSSIQQMEYLASKTQLRASSNAYIMFEKANRYFSNLSSAISNFNSCLYANFPLRDSEIISVQNTLFDYRRDFTSFLVDYLNSTTPLIDSVIVSSNRFLR